MRRSGPDLRIENAAQRFGFYIRNESAVKTFFASEMMQNMNNLSYDLCSVFPDAFTNASSSLPFFFSQK